MEREKYIAAARQTPTEELFGQLFLSLIRKNRYFNEFQYKELSRRMGRFSAMSIFGMSKATIDASRGVGKVTMSAFK